MGSHARGHASKCVQFRIRTNPAMKNAAPNRSAFENGMMSIAGDNSETAVVTAKEAAIAVYLRLGTCVCVYVCVRCRL